MNIDNKIKRVLYVYEKYNLPYKEIPSNVKNNIIKMTDDEFENELTSLEEYLERK